MDKKEIFYPLDPGKLDDVGGQALHEHHRYINNWKDSFIIIYQEYLRETISNTFRSSN
jgi:hypothetical protein